jgi:hypothetical protein
MGHAGVRQNVAGRDANTRADRRRRHYNRRMTGFVES